MEQSHIKYSLLFGLLGALFFIPFLGGAHLFDWDEINFAEISREMIATGDYLRVYMNYLPFWEKPPFFFWLQATAMHVFGINEFASRLPNAICGIITLVLLFNIGTKLYDEQFGKVWALVYLGTILPHLYFKSGIIDPFFNLFIFSGLYLFMLFLWKKHKMEDIQLKSSKLTYLFWGGFLIGMAILTKGPVAYLIVVLTLGVYWLYQRFRMYISILEFLFFSIAASLVMLAWLGLETIQNGIWFVKKFTAYQYRLFSTPDAGHQGFPGFHFVVLLVGCFPASVFAIRAFFKMPEAEFNFQHDFRKWMLILFWVVLILFSVVQSKIVHYSSLSYFPLTFLSALCIYEILKGRIEMNSWMKRGLYLIGGLYIIAILALPYLGNHPDLIKPLFNDPFAEANLEAEVIWTGWEILPGILLLGILISFSYFMKHGKKWLAMKALFGGTAIFILLTLIFFINRIEGYSQRAAIDFLKSKAQEDCYVVTRGYKSYAHLFYAQKPPVVNKASIQWDWLIKGDIDKPVYVITKIHKTHQLKDIDSLNEIGRKNGFVFYKREIQNEGNLD